MRGFFTIFLPLMAFGPLAILVLGYAWYAADISRWRTEHAAWVAHNDRTVPAVAVSPWVARWDQLNHVVDAPSFSATHWNNYFTVRMNNGVERYAANHKASIEEWEALAFGDDIEQIPYQDYAPGTAVVKQHRAQEQAGEPFYVAMVKHEPGYDPDGHDWEYIETDRRGAVIMNGPGYQPDVKKRCFECHTSVAHRDYLFHDAFADSRR